MSFNDHLRDVQRQRRSLLCVGLDIDPAKLPEPLKGRPDGVVEFARAIVAATQDLVCAFKPNLAFFEALGRNGWDALRRTLDVIPPGVVTIGDGKRADIGNTSARYASALFTEFGFHAVTVNPYMGSDSVEPFLADPEHGVFLLALTSNPGSRDFQRKRVGSGRLYEAVVRTARKWNTRGNLGLVVGATHPSELKRVRALAPDMPLLIPGIGTQGGDLRASIRWGCTADGDLAVINASRSILYASSGRDFADAARAEALRLRDAIEEQRHHFFSE